MPACLSRSVGLPPLFPVSSSSLKTMQMEDQENGKRRSVLRRTLSAAEMCSKSWRAQGIKKTASVEHLQSLVRDEEEGNGSGSGSEGAFEDVWSSIRRKTEEAEQRPTAVDVWGSILSEKKAGEDDVAPAAYVHPLVKRSASSLSEKSLEICTESLGSETGADGFSFLDADKEGVAVQNDVVFGAEVDEEMKEPGQQEEEVGPMVNFGGYAVVGATRTKRVAAEEGKNRTLPPPLPSLGHREDGSNLQMRCHRQDGRLVVEAVSVPSRNCFRAERQDGRLLLTFSDKESGEEGHEFEEDDDEDEEEEISDVWGVEEEEEEGEGEDDEGLEEEFAMEEEYGRGGMVMMTTKDVDYKFLCLTRNSPPAASWAHRLNKVVPTLDGEDMAKSSPDSKGMGQIIPITAAGTAGTLNPYVYGWRSVPGGGSSVLETKEGFVGGGGCNGQLQQAPTRRSLLFWPDRTRCIATS